MTQLVQVGQMNKIEQVLVGGNLAALSEMERLQYYKAVCESLGLNPLTKPFDYIQLNGKLVLYTTKSCTEQLRSIRGISLKIIDKQAINEVYVVTAEAKDREGREDSATGAVSIAGLKGDALANAMMKAETKAKRRVTLSISGLGLLDESELETIPAKAKGGVFPDQPNEVDGVSIDAGYRIPFGKFAKRSLEELDIDQLRDYVNYLERSAEKKGTPLSGVVLDFVERASSHIAAFETGGVDVSDSMGAST